MADPTQQDEWAEFRAPGMYGAEGVQDEWAEFREPGLAEKGMALVKGAVGGVQQTGGMVVGAMGGLKAGAMVAPFLGPAAPFAPGVGAAVGGVAGLVAGTKARELSVGELEDLPPALRPYAVFGETGAGAMVPAGAIAALGAKGFQTAGTSVVGRWFNRVLETAGKAPKTFLATEAGLAVSAAGAGAASETFYPGHPMVRMASEMVGGTISVPRLTHWGAKKAIGLAGKVAAVWSVSARETVAGKTILRALEAAGDDPVAVARLLREADALQVLQPTTAPATPRTAAQLTGSQGLAALERRVGQMSQDFAARAHGAADENLEAIRRLMDHLVRTGDPDALKAAAEMRKDYFKTLLSSRLKYAENEALQFAQGITPDTPEAQTALSAKASNLLTEALDDARAAEAELWGAVPQDLIGGFEGVKSRLRWWTSELTEEQRHHIPEVARAFIARVQESGAASVKDLKGIRSELMSAAAAAALDPSRRMEAKIAGELAEAALDDMLQIPGVGDSYDAARAFSKELNDTFTRSFVGKAAAGSKYGARVPPELLMKKALASGPEAAAIQLQELEDATQFMVKHAKDEAMMLRSSEMVSDMLDIQERLIRLAADAARPIDPKTGFPGKVSVKALGDFIRKRPDLLNRFPEVKADLDAALTSEVARARITAVSENRASLVLQKAAFAKLAKGDPIRVMETTLRSTTMEKELTAFIKVAKGRGAGPEAMDGLRASVLEAAMRKSTTRTGTLSLPEFRAALFDPPIPGGRSVMDVLQDKGAIAPETVNLMQKVFGEAEKIIASQRPKMAIDEIEDAPGILYDLITRVAGASVAGKIAGASGSEAHGLIVAHGGSKAAREIVQKLPNMKIQAVLADLLANRPEAIADLLEKQATPARQIQAARRLNSYLFTSGAYGATEYVHQESEDGAPRISDAALSVM